MDNGETVLGGRYRLLDVLGDGGMARVYRAEDIRLKRTVALKTPHEQYRSQPDFRRRFEQEAHLAGRLAHPNIVAIYDIGYDGTVPFLVMEYVDGGSLKRLLAQQGVPPLPRVLAIMHQLGQALDAAHARGVIHRDIKPENILLTSEGHVKVSDFGIARARDTTDHTTTGVVVGSATYLAPEQAQGRTVTPQTDLYSSGVVLYEMLTGHPPFSAETAVATALQHVTRQPSPPSALVPGLPSRVDAVVLRALAKEPRARYASGEMLADSLGSALGAWSRAGNTRPHQAISPGAMPGAGGGLRYHTPSVPAAAPAPRGRKPNAYALPLALVLLLGTGTAVALNGVRDLVGSPVATLGSGASPAARPAPPARAVPRARHAVVVRHRSRALLAGFVPLSVAPALPDLVLEHRWRVPHSTHTASRAPRTAARPARHPAPRPHPTPPAPGLSPAISLSIAHAVGYNYVPIAVSRRFVLGTGPAYVIARWGSLGPGHAVSLSWSSPGGSAGSYRGCAGWWNVCFTQVPLQAAGTYTVTFFVDATAVTRRQFVVSGS